MKIYSNKRDEAARENIGFWMNGGWRKMFFFLAWELAWKAGPSRFCGNQFDFIMTERHAWIGEIEWAFWAATSFGLAFKNVGRKKKKKKRRRRWPEKKKRKEVLNLKEQHVWAEERNVLGWTKKRFGLKKYFGLKKRATRLKKRKSEALEKRGKTGAELKQKGHWK